MEKFVEYIHESEKTIRAVDYMTYVTFPLIKEKRLLIKIILEIKKALAYCINAVLQYEYVYKRIQMSADTKTNFKTFIGKSSKRFEITSEEIKKILEVFELVENHKQSSMEFAKDDKVVILSSSMQQSTLTLEKIKEYVFLAKSILKKTKNNIQKSEKDINTP